VSSLINDKCINCGVCLPVCPTGSITSGARTYVVDSDTCTDCLLCAPVCPVEAFVNPLVPPRPKVKTKKK